MTPRYVSIAECETCSRIPQKVSEDIEATGVPQLVPPEVGRLSVVVELDDAGTPAYCTSTTRLLKCELCGTHYYWNRYDDDGQHFMDPTCDEITLRRYGPLSAIGFLEGVLARSAGALPAAFGQMKKAFAEGTRPPAAGIAAAGLEAELQEAAAELAELRERCDETLRDLADLLWRRAVDGQIQLYAVESLCHRFVARGDWAGLSATLLRHPDPAVRLLAARIVIGIGTDDAPAIDLVHVSREMRQALAGELARRSRVNELIDLLLEIVLSSGDAEILEYDHGYGRSSYHTVKARWIALYYLRVLAGSGADLARTIGPLAGLLGNDKALNRAVCRTLRALIENRRRTARLRQRARSIAGEVEAHAARRAELLRDPDVQELLAACREHM